MHYDGSGWTPVTIPAPAPLVTLRGVTGGGKHDVWIVGDAGTILYFDGTSWARWTDASGVALRGVWNDTDTRGTWIVGDLGVILHSGPATK